MKSLEKVQQIIQFVKRYTADDSEENDPDLLENHLTGMATPGPGFYYVFDFTSFEFEYVSEEVTEVLHLTPQEFKLNNKLQLIHPDDLEYYVNSMEAIVNCYFHQIAPADRPYYKANIPYRVRVGSEYRLFLQQEGAISFDQRGMLLKNLGWMSDISHIMYRHNRRVSLLGRQGRPSYYGLKMTKDRDDYQPETVVYSERELQVLGLLSRGLSNEKIGQSLNISQDTVRTHRKNILAKSNAVNSVQAVANAIRNGII